MSTNARLITIFLVTLFVLPMCLYAQDPYRIGWIGPLTGNASALGVDSLHVTKMLVEQINQAGTSSKIKVKLFVEDDQYQAAKTVSAYQKLVKQDKLDFLIVITYGGLFAIAEQSKRDGVIIVDPLDCDDAIAALPVNILCIAKKTEELGRLNAISAIANADMPAAILYYEGDPFMGRVAQTTIDTIKESGGSIAYKAGYTDQSADFRSMLLRAKAKGAKSFFFYGYDQIGSAMKQARQIGITAPFYAMNTISSPGFRATAGAALEGSFVSTWLAPKTDEYKRFISQFKKRVGRAPYLEISTIPTYDTLKLLFDALHTSKLGGDERRNDVLLRYFYSVANYKGLSGLITIDSDGITRSLKNSFYTFEKGQFIPFKLKENKQ